MRVKAAVCTGIVFLLMILLGSWVFFRVEALAYDGGPDAAGRGAALPNFIYNPECISGSPLLGTKQFSSGRLLPEDAAGAARSSQLVVRGKILEVYYTFADGQAWTQASVQVLDCLKGSPAGEEPLSVYFQGGYVSAEDFAAFSGGSREEGFYRVVSDGVPLPTEGEEGLFFLNERPEGSSLPEGTYLLSCGRYSVMSPAEDGQLVSASGSRYSYDQLCALIARA